MSRVLPPGNSILIVFKLLWSSRVFSENHIRLALPQPSCDKSCFWFSALLLKVSTAQPAAPASTGALAVFHTPGQRDHHTGQAWSCREPSLTQHHTPGLVKHGVEKPAPEPRFCQLGACHITMGFSPAWPPRPVTVLPGVSSWGNFGARPSHPAVLSLPQRRLCLCSAHIHLQTQTSRQTPHLPLPSRPLALHLENKLLESQLFSVSALLGSTEHFFTGVCLTPSHSCFSALPLRVDGLLSPLPNTVFSSPWGRFIPNTAQCPKVVKLVPKNGTWYEHPFGGISCSCLRVCFVSPSPRGTDLETRQALTLAHSAIHGPCIMPGHGGRCWANSTTRKNQLCPQEAPRPREGQTSKQADRQGGDSQRAPEPRSWH